MIHVLQRQGLQKVVWNWFLHWCSIHLLMVLWILWICWLLLFWRVFSLFNSLRSWFSLLLSKVAWIWSLHLKLQMAEKSAKESVKLFWSSLSSSALLRHVIPITVIETLSIGSGVCIFFNKQNLDMEIMVLGFGCLRVLQSSKENFEYFVGNLFNIKNKFC